VIVATQLRRGEPKKSRLSSITQGGDENRDFVIFKARDRRVVLWTVSGREHSVAEEWFGRIY